MHHGRYILIILLFINSLVCDANDITKKSKKILSLMMPYDVLHDSLSGIIIRATQAQLVTGLYIQHLSSNPANCTAGALVNASGNGFGMLWFSQNFSNNDTAVIGDNYLYNAIASAIIINASPFGGGPNCTPGNIANNNACNTHTPAGWCVQLGLVNLNQSNINGAGYGGIADDITNTPNANLLNANKAGTLNIVISCTDAQSTTTAGTCTAAATVQDFPIT